jgi:hypothetical protein
VQAREESDGSLVLTHDSIRLSRVLFILGAIMLGAAGYSFVIGERGTDRLIGLLAGAATVLLAGIVVLDQSAAKQ